MSSFLSLADVAYLMHRRVPVRLLYHIARMHGRVLHMTDRRAALAVTNNLRDAFKHDKTSDEVAEMTKQFFEYKQLRALLLTVFRDLHEYEKEELFPIEGLGHLERALAENKGAILLGSHLHSIVTFIAKDMLRGKGYDVRVAIPTKEMPYAPTFVRKIIDSISANGNKRESDQGGAFHAQFNIKPIMQCLAHKAAVILMGDGWHAAGFVEVKFLGRSLCFPTAAVNIARSTGAPVLPFFVIGRPPDMLRIVIEPPIPLEHSGDAVRDLTAMVADYARRLEGHLYRNVPCWQHWLEDRILEKMSTRSKEALSDRYHIEKR